MPPAACESLGLGADFPLSRWLRHASGSAEPPAASGFVVLAGNATAHASALRCWLQADSLSGGEVRHLSSVDDAWEELSCASGCPSLLDDVSAAVDRRAGRWGVLFIREAERAPAVQIGALATKFFHAGRCTYATAQTRVAADCRRILFALSTRWGFEALAHPEARVRPRHRILASALAEAAPWLSAPAVGMAARQRLRSAVTVVLGDAPRDSFDALMAAQDAARVQWRSSKEQQRQHWQLQQVRRQRQRSGQSAEALHEPDLTAFDRVAGQQEVVREVRARLGSIASGADGGEDAHTFFFYGFPGTGKTLLAELVALAQHGSAAPPNYARFSMQNYKTDEDMWKLVSPPCGVKGEGAFANLYAKRVGCERGSGEADDEACGSAAPVVLFDEIEEARADFMTSALVNAIDHRGFVEFSRKLSDGRCTTEHAPTAGSFIILTSNCFLDELSTTLAAERRPGRSDRDVYAAVRAAMDEKIFEGGLACDASGTPSPFGARKMRDRMRGNLYPFLPLRDDEMVSAFETQLYDRADGYNASRGVQLYWTREFARLIVERSAASTGSRSSRMHAIGLAGAGGGGGEVVDGDKKGRARSASEAPSLRKLIEQLMRLDEFSVEKLYAGAADGCKRRGGRLRALVLHVLDGSPAAKPTCEVDDNDIEPPAAPATPVHATAESRGGGDSQWERRSASASGQGGGDAAASTCADADVDVATDHMADAAAEVDGARMQALRAAHAAELESAKLREEALMNEVARLIAKVDDLQASLMRWQLLSAALVLVTAAALLGAGHIILTYSLFMLKATASASLATAALGLVAYASLALLCRSGLSDVACTLQDLLVEVARWAWWALRWAWEVLWRLFGGRFWAMILAAACLVLYVKAAVRHSRRRGRPEEAGAKQASEAAVAKLEAAHRAEASAASVALLVMLAELRAAEAAAAGVIGEASPSSGAAGALVALSAGAARSAAGTTQTAVTSAAGVEAETTAVVEHEQEQGSATPRTGEQQRAQLTDLNGSERSESADLNAE